MPHVPAASKLLSWLLLRLFCGSPAVSPLQPQSLAFPLSLTIALPLPLPLSFPFPLSLTIALSLPLSFPQPFPGSHSGRPTCGCAHPFSYTLCPQTRLPIALAHTRFPFHRRASWHSQQPNIRWRQQQQWRRSERSSHRRSCGHCNRGCG